MNKRLKNLIIVKDNKEDIVKVNDTIKLDKSQVDKEAKEKPNQADRIKKYRIKKGQVLNPKGRPKGKGLSITTEIKRKLQESYPNDKDKKATYLKKIIQTIMDKAIKEKDRHIIKQIWNYIDGMPKQNIELEKPLLNVNIYTPEQKVKIAKEIVDNENNKNIS